MKFKRGARVRVYHGDRTFTGEVAAIADGKEQHLYVWEDGALHLGACMFHPKQCRLLKPRPKKYGRSLYALVPTYGASHVKAYFDRSDAERRRDHGLENIVEFIEVMKELT